MKPKQLLITLFILIISFASKAQDGQPFKSIGKKVKVLTLSKGKYIEFFDYDTIQRMGTVLYNIRTKKIVRLLNADSVYKKASNNTSASRWYSPDPLADKFASLSPYNFAENNPINKIDPTGAETESIHLDTKGNVLRNYNDGDNSVFVHAKGITGKQIDKTYTTAQHSAGGLKIGELGKTINANGIFKNFLDNNISYAQGIVNPLTFRNLVKGHGNWDLKNNKNTIYGLANSFDKGKDIKTLFSFQGKDYTTPDLGNFHYGATGMAVWFLTSQFLLEQAGAAQMAAGTSKPEWQVHEDRIIGTLHGGSQIIKGGGVLIAPYGDDPRDQEMIIEGFQYYKTNKK